MPRMVTTYYCEHCGRKYFTEEKAVACENSHLVPISVGKPEYNSDESSTKKVYPESVLVHLKDASGKEVSARYYRR